MLVDTVILSSGRLSRLEKLHSPMADDLQDRVELLICLHDPSCNPVKCKFHGSTRGEEGAAMASSEGSACLPAMRSTWKHTPSNSHSGTYWNVDLKQLPTKLQSSLACLLREAWSNASGFPADRQSAKKHVKTPQSYLHFYCQKGSILDFRVQKL